MLNETTRASETEQNKELTLLNLLELETGQFNKLKSQVEQNSGVVEIYVHPFYYSNYNSNNSLDPKKYAKAREVEEKIISEFKNSKPEGVKPVRIIFEEIGRNSELQDQLSETNEGILYVETKPAQALPFGEQDAVDKLVTILKKLGVKKVQLAGSLLLKNYRYGEPSMEGCVGQAQRILKPHFETDIIENLTFAEERPKQVFRYGNE